MRQCPFANPNFANRPAIRSATETFSYSQINQKISQAAQAFISRGLKSGSRIGLLANNSVSAAVIFFAAQRVGLSVVPLNLRLRPEDWARQLQSCGVKLAIVEEKFPALAGIEVLPEAEFFEGPAYSGVDLDPSREGVVVFTSGSNGAPKGAALSIAALYASAEASNERSGFSATDSWLASIPFYHVGGLGILYRAALVGGSIALAEEISSLAIERALASLTPTFVSLVPESLDRLLSEDRAAIPNSVRMIVLGGSAASLDLRNKIKARRLSVLFSYGMTETASHIALSSPRQVGSGSGQLLKGVQLKASAEGMLIRGPMLFSGYVKETGVEPRAEWFNTRDLGELDAAGEVVVHGRADRMFISGGENIYPEEIENAATGIPGVRAAAVIAIPSVRWGMRPVLFVEGERRPDEVTAALGRILAKIKVPDRVIVIPQIPKTGIGKVDYRKLAELGIGQQ